MLEKWISELRTRLGEEQVLCQEPMARHTTFRVGGPAEILVKPNCREQITAVLEICRQAGLPWMVMGSGSNLLVREGGIKGVVIELGAAYRDFFIEGSQITASAGVHLSSLSRQAARHELSGLEFAEGIPGSLGGAVFMNAGAYDGEMSQIVEQVVSLHPQTGEEIIRRPDDIGFSYRHSCYQENGEIILEATLRLTPGNEEEITARMRELAKSRREKQPLDLPSAGSTFKRPPGMYVGPLIEELGLKGYSIGGAQVSEKHCGFIVNRDHASAADVLALIRYVQERVFNEKGVRLETEVRIVGEEIQKC